MGIDDLYWVHLDASGPDGILEFKFIFLLCYYEKTESGRF